MRVHELAKELEISSKDLLPKLHDLGIEAKSHMSALLDEELERALESLTDNAPSTDLSVDRKSVV